MGATKYIDKTIAGLLNFWVYLGICTLIFTYFLMIYINNITII